MKTCTSITRPESPNIGDTFIELDTEFIIIWTGASWDKILYGDTFFANTLVGSFDGTGDYLQLGNGILTVLSGTNYSISMWYKLDQEGYYMEPFSAGGTTGERVLVYFRSRGSGTVSIEFYAGSAAYLIEPAPFQSIGAWVNSVITVDTGGTSNLYVNGVSKAASTSVPQVTPTNPVIGCLNGASNFLDGKIDEVAIFDSTLSATKVAAIYNGGVPADLTSLSPVGWWRIGDGKGDTDSGGGAPASGDTIGTVVNQGSLGSSANATNSSGALYSSDVPSNKYSLDFDGTDDYVDIGSSGDMGSFSLWFKPDSTITTGTTGQYLLSFSANSSAFGNLGLGSSTGNATNEVLTFNQGNRAYAYTGSGLTINTDWHHVGGRWTGSTYEFYLDGTQVKNAEGGAGAAGQVAFSALKIGGRGAASNFAGLIDEVAIWTDSLSASEIVAIYNSGTPTDLTSYSPLGWWRMGDNDGGTGTTVTDQGSGGNNGTLTNGPTYSSTVPS